MKIIQALAIGTLLILNVGCECTHYVRNLGLTRVELRPKSVFVDKEENIVIEAKLLHTQRAPKQTTDLGLRYIHGNAETLRQTIAISKKHSSNNSGPFILVSPTVKSDYTGPIDPKQSPLWYLTPPDTRHSAPESTRVSPFGPGNASVYRFGEPITFHEADGNAIDVRFQFLSVDSPHYQFRAAWGYPLQILVVPAFAADILVSPIRATLLVGEIADLH